jgi:hypothetical protein
MPIVSDLVALAAGLGYRDNACRPPAADLTVHPGTLKAVTGTAIGVRNRRRREQMQTEHDAKAVVVVALAGRRIDAPGSDSPRFPLDNVPTVRTRLTELMSVEHVTALVSSAACGADLVALEEADRLGLRRRIVLPFSPERFRKSSVVDRPGDWGPVFDRLIFTAERAEDLVVLREGVGDDNMAYAAANEAIIREAQLLADAGAPSRLIAVVVWEGGARAGTDATEAFRQLASIAGFEQRSVATL